MNISEDPECLLELLDYLGESSYITSRTRVVPRGWVINYPRLRDMLSRMLARGQEHA
jgi:hypothetical protein